MKKETNPDPIPLSPEIQEALTKQLQEREELQQQQLQTMGQAIEAFNQRYERNREHIQSSIRRASGRIV